MRVKLIGHQYQNNSQNNKYQAAADGTMDERAARFVWKLARRHTWGSPIPPDDLVRLTARDESHDELREVLNQEVLTLPFVAQNSSGVHIPNGRDTHRQAAEWLQKETGLSDLKIGATLSRLPDEWPHE